MGSSLVDDLDEDRGLSPATLNTLRGILISSLPRENAPVEMIEPLPLSRRKVTFKDCSRGRCNESQTFAGGGSGQGVNEQLLNIQNAGSLPANVKSQTYPRTDFYWFAHGGDLDCEAKDGQPTPQQIDREERLRLIKEKQNEERQKKLEELKQQALAAQKFREKSEEERRRRIEDLRNRENDRRHQVEERKRLIMEAERDRREAILRRNMEREARIESKRKMERSSIVFAFGSSTPRMLEPTTDSGSTYWASRRATSTTNVMSMSVASPGPLTRRSSERELVNGNKKRATSAGGLLDRKNVDGECKENYMDVGTTLTVQRSAARRKTDLMPTVPSSREPAPYHATGSRNNSVCSSRRSPGSRSGETTPRSPSALSQHCSSNSGIGMSRPRPATAPSRKPRPTSIAVTGVTSSSDFVRPSSSIGKSPSENRHAIPKVHVTKKSTKTDAGRKIEKPKSTKSSVITTPKETPLQSPTVELSTEGSFTGSESGDRSQTANQKTETSAGISPFSEKLTQSMFEQKSNEFASSDGVSDLAECDMTGSMTSSQIRRITTEEEAKAALAERRKLAREQAEREAEIEQQRLEAERLAEEERLRKEEEEQRKMEEEQLRLIEEAKKAEETRLLQAIEEAQRREEEERQRKEEELKLKLEKEEADKKAKEEAEKARQEMELKLKKEEADRQERRKRVELIMSRTRAKGGTPSVTPTKENNSDIIDEKVNGISNKVISDNSNNNNNNNNNNNGNNNNNDSIENDPFLDAERNGNGASEPLNHKQNGVHYSIESRNVTNNLLDLSDFDVINTNMITGAAVSPQILDLPVKKDNYNSTDLLS